MFNLIYQIREKDVKLLLKAIYKDKNDLYLLYVIDDIICISTKDRKTLIKMINIIERYKNKRIKVNEIER
jgi:hypothetical protein